MTIQQPLRTIPQIEESSLVLYPPRVVCAATPASVVTLREYYGTLERRIQLHHEYPGQTFFVIADYRAFHRSDGAGAEAGPTTFSETLDLATIYLGLGLDPRKAVLYRESDVPEIMELACVLSQCCRECEWAGPKSHGSDLSTLFLLAGEILSMRGTLVPALPEQQSDIDLVGDFARSFNRRYDREVFPIPEAHLCAVKPLHGIDEQSTNEVLSMISPFSTWGDIRNTVAAALPDQAQETLARSADDLYRFDLRSDYDKWKRQPGDVEEILRNGGIRAREEAAGILDEVRSLIGVRSDMPRIVGASF